MKSLVLHKTGSPTKFNPSKTIRKIAGTEGLMKAYERARDLDGFATALDGHIAAKREFVQGYKTKFTSQSSGVLSRSEKYSDFLREHHIGATTIHRWAKLLDDTFAWEYRQQSLDKVKRLFLGEMAHVGHNSGVSEWYTPELIINMTRHVMGGIDLDPATSLEAQKVIQARETYTRETDGLKQQWRGRLWLNPPYSQPEIGQFINKLVSTDCEAMVLVNNATETEWCQKLLLWAKAVCFPNGRVKFWQPGKEAVPLQGQLIAYSGPNITKFISEFKTLGVCLYAR